MIIDSSELSDIRKKNKGKIVFAMGAFDLFHYEHLRYLQAAKELGDVLVVGVKDNYCTHFKGNDRPIIDEFYRAQVIDNIKGVDYVVMMHYDDNLKTTIKCLDDHQLRWLKIHENTFKQLRPDVLYYEIKPEIQFIIDQLLDKYNITGVSRVRTAIICTTSIINKIKNTN